VCVMRSGHQIPPRLGQTRACRQARCSLSGGFRERTPKVEAAVPAEIYHLRSADEVADLLRAAGLVPSLSAGPDPGLWVAQARVV